MESVFLNEHMGASKDVVMNLTVYVFYGCLIHLVDIVSSTISRAVSEKRHKNSRFSSVM